MKEQGALGGSGSREAKMLHCRKVSWELFFSLFCFVFFLASLLTFPSRGSRLLKVRGEARFCELIRTQRQGGGRVFSELAANLK